MSDTKTPTFDLFISYAQADRTACVDPLYERLTAAGYVVWLDENEMLVGDSKRRETDKGIARTRYGVPILSAAYFVEETALRQLDGLTARETAGQITVLPVRHGISESDVMAHSATLADKVAADTDRGMDDVVLKLMAVVGLSESESARSGGSQSGGFAGHDQRIQGLMDAVNALSELREDGAGDLNARIEDALRLASTGDPEKAEVILREVAKERTEQGRARNREAAEAWGHIGALAYEHDTQKALEAYRAATGLEPDNAAWWTWLGHLLTRVGELDEAVEAYERVMETGRTDEKDGSWELPAAYGNLGLIYRTRGDLDKAEEYHRKSLEMNESLGRQEGMAAVYGNLGLIYRARGDLDKAEKYLRKSLEIEESLGRQEGMASQYGNLGLIYRTRGDLDKAEEYHRKSLEIEETLGRQEGMAVDYGNLGIVFEERGDKGEARKYWVKAKGLWEKLGNPGEVDGYQAWIDGLDED